MHKLYCLDIYMTNVCPNKCTHCSTFNNHNFSGHMSWKYNKPFLEQWAERCEFQDMGLLGGEPLVHPEYHSWVKGIREIFPNQKRLSVATGLYPYDLKHNVEKLHFAIEHNVRIEFNVHDPAFWDETLEFIENTLFKNMHWRKDTESIEPGSIEWPDSDLHYYVDNKTICDVLPAWEFIPNPIKEIKDGVAIFHNSDPVKAFNTCHLKVCHTYRDGKIYLCQNTAVGEEFAKQFVTDEKTYKILTSADYILPSDSDEKINLFIENLKKPCIQCSLCVEDGSRPVLITPTPNKKIKLTKVKDFL